MKILARGEKSLIEELKLKLPNDVELVEIQDSDLPSIDLTPFQLIFDLSFDKNPESIKYYAPLKSKVVIVAAIKTQLAKAVSLYNREVECTLIGMNTLPSFINRSLAEVSICDDKHVEALDFTMKQLGWEYKLVHDRVGMITPRIVFMIINEACYTLQEGTASMKDIDVSMKLGTNYPFGPFEWADKIGIQHVYETLEALYQDTHDERYKICPLLKTIYLKNGTFYS